MFANIVVIIAAELKDAGDFVNRMMEMFAQDEDIYDRGSEGFKPKFRDDVGPENTPNQVRHCVGGLGRVLCSALWAISQ